MAIHTTTSRNRIHGSRSAAALSLLIIAFLLLGTTSALAITRATVLARAQVWVDRLVPYSQSKYFGGYRTDCSGFTSMSWQTRSGGHAISYSTRSLHTVSSVIPTDSLKPGDALVKYDYHARVFYGWVDAAHTKYVAYEQTGPCTKSSIKDLASDIRDGYKPYRRTGITDGPPSWNALANATFDVWASGSPVWWGFRSDAWGAGMAQRKDRVTGSNSSLGLFNPSARTRDHVEVSQTATVTAGMPYTLSLWAVTNTAPGSVDVRLTFLDAAGGAISTTSTTGAAWSVEATAFARMSVTATAPAQAASATVTVRLAGGVDATGTAGTTAIIDSVRLYVSTPVLSHLTLSVATVTRRHRMTLRGTVEAPMPLGTVRIYVKRPGSTKTVFLADRPLSSGAWSMPATPTLRGTYTFTAKYLGYGPWGPVASAPVSLRVK